MRERVQNKRRIIRLHANRAVVVAFHEVCAELNDGIGLPFHKRNPKTKYFRVSRFLLRMRVDMDGEADELSASFCCA